MWSNDYRDRSSRGRSSGRGNYDSYASGAGGSMYSASTPVQASTGPKTYWSGAPARTKTVQDQVLDNIIVGHLTDEQVDAYQQFFRIEEISHLLRTAELNRQDVLSLLPSGNAANTSLKREPSPPPKYDSHGNRTNSRTTRVTEELVKERHLLVELAMGSIKEYTAPPDYKKPMKTSEKLYVPIKDYPDINFVGFLLGPRGNTLRKLQDESGARLAIRGKGSVKDGKSTNSRLITDSDSSGNNTDAAEDDLHVVITADSQQKIAVAVKLVNEIIEKLISSPVHENDLKREQLRELAVLNGTLRETQPFDPNKYKNNQMNNRSKFDVTRIVCIVCGNVGHLARDCKFKGQAPGQTGAANMNEDRQQQSAQFDVEEVDVIPPWKKVKTDTPAAPVVAQPPPGIQPTATVSQPPPPGIQPPGTQAPPGLPQPPVSRPPPPASLPPPPGTSAPVTKPPPPQKPAPPPKPLPPQGKPAPPPPKTTKPPPPPK